MIAKGRRDCRNGRFRDRDVIKICITIGRDRVVMVQRSPNARNTVERFVTNGPLWSVILTIHNVLDRYGRYERYNRYKSRDLGAFLL